MTKPTERQLLERAAEVAGLKGEVWELHGELVVCIRDEFTARKNARFWNPRTSLSDRYELLRAMGAVLNFFAGTVTVILDLDGGSDEIFAFCPGYDASEATAILQAANAVWESRHAED